MSRVILGDKLEGRGSLHLDVARLLETRLLIQAGSGAGKSYSIRRLCEVTEEKVQKIILDVEGEFATLREKGDYILAGKGGDVATDLRTAELLARRALEHEFSLIVDLYELKHHDRIRYVREFAEALINAPKELWRPVLIVIDEAHLFAPEKGQSEATSAVIDLATRGRKRGLALIPATQRLSKLHKDVAAECLNKMIGRTGLDIDMKRAGEELGFTSKEQMLSLRKLQPGEFYAFGPAISDEVTAFKVGPVETTHPKSGQRLARHVPKATAAVKKLLVKLGDLPKEAEEDIRDREKMQMRIRELERELRESKTAVKVETKTEKVVDEKAIERAVRATKREIAKHVQKLNYSLINAIGPVVDETVKKCSAILEVPAEAPPPSIIQKPSKPKPLSPPASVGDRTFGACDRKILGFLLAKAGAKFTPQQAATMTGYANSGGFRNALSNLNQADLIVRSGGLVSINPEAVAEAERLADNEPHRLEDWIAKLGACERAVFQKLLASPRETFSKEEISSDTGYQNSGGFRNALSRLNTLGLIKRYPGGRIGANPEVQDL